MEVGDISALKVKIEVDGNPVKSKNEKVDIRLSQEILEGYCNFNNNQTQIQEATQEDFKQRCHQLLEDCKNSENQGLVESLKKMLPQLQLNQQITNDNQYRYNIQISHEINQENVIQQNQNVVQPQEQGDFWDQFDQLWNQTTTYLQNNVSQQKLKYIGIGLAILGFLCAPVQVSTTTTCTTLLI